MTKKTDFGNIHVIHEGPRTPLGTARRKAAHLTGQSHLNSDATIAHEGRPQGAPLHQLQLSFCPRWPEGRATRKPLRHHNWFSTKGRYVVGRAPTRGALSFWLGRYVGRAPTLSFLGVVLVSRRYGRGRAVVTRGAPDQEIAFGNIPIVFSRRYGLGRAPTRGAPTDCPSKGGPQGAPIKFGATIALGRAPTRGAPTRFRQPHEVFSNLMQLPWRS